MIDSRGIHFKGLLKSVHPAFFHLFFWVGFISFEVSLASSISEKLGHPLDYALHYALCIALAYYHCFYVLNPTIGGTRKNFPGLLLRFFLEVLVFFICGTLISLGLDFLKIERTWNFRDSNFIFGNLYRCVYMLIISTSYWIALHLIRKQKHIHRMERSKLIAEMAKEKLKIYTEMALLKATINPHMLSNNLNLLYSQVKKIDETAGEQIMTLAELMRFSLTEINDDGKIMLQDELQYIENYIHFFKQRISSNIVFLKEGQHTDFQQPVIPLLLATLVENIFQHGDLSEPKSPASITISCKDGLLNIITVNKVGLSIKKGHGIGLANLQKRLHYAYPEAYHYSNHTENNFYKTCLKINLNNSALC